MPPDEFLIRARALLCASGCRLPHAMPVAAGEERNGKEGRDYTRLKMSEVLIPANAKLLLMTTFGFASRGAPIT